MTDILLVDAEQMILNILKKNIPWSQYDMQIVGCCSNGEQALEFLKTHKVSLVFTDIKMPHMDGLELIRRCLLYTSTVVQVILRKITIENSSMDVNAIMAKMSNKDQSPGGETLEAAITVITIVPMLVIYPFLQKYFVKGIMVGSIKG